MRARVTQGIGRRIAKLVNPLLDLEAKQLAKSRERDAQARDAKQSVLRVQHALRHGVDALVPSERAKLTRGQWTVVGMPRAKSDEAWQRDAMASQAKLIEEVRK